MNWLIVDGKAYNIDNANYIDFEYRFMPQDSPSIAIYFNSEMKTVPASYAEQIKAMMKSSKVKK